MAYRNTVAMARALFEERRAARADDLMSHLLDEEVDGRPLTRPSWRG